MPSDTCVDSQHEREGSDTRYAEPERKSASGVGLYHPCKTLAIRSNRCAHLQNRWYSATNRPKGVPRLGRMHKN